MQNPAPTIDKRDTEEIAKEIRTLAPYYVPELDLSDDTGAGIALLKIFSRMQKLVIDRLNRVPPKNFVAFLDMIGMGLLPAQPARAPVTFYLAEGTTENAPIPEKTQIAAGEVVFETDANMVATPSKLKKAYSIDVANDRIYESPPGIISGERAVAFGAKLLYDASMGDEEIFVNGNEGLNKEDLLVIGKGTRVDYGIVSEVSDSRVTLLHKLENGHDAGSLVEKVTSFELFKGKNLQEHTLYLGHKDLFNIKEASEIRIKTRFYSELSDRHLVRWEYWGEDAEKNTGWHLLTIETPIQPADKAVNLKKDCAGEIKEQKIDGVESRWIRCRTIDGKIDGKISKTESILLDTLHIGVGPGAGQVLQYRTLSPQAIRGIGETFGERLSKDGVGTIEELLEFKDRVDDLARILSGGKEPSRYHERAENILENAQKHILDKNYEDQIAKEPTVAQGVPPDLAFHNDAPMDLTTSNGQFTTPIYPFGTAPRTYDTFYIASQEALSKKGSKIAIDVSVEPRGETVLTPTLSWEYWNGKGWVALKGIIDGTTYLLETGQIACDLPEDIDETEVSGQKSYWIRARIVGGDYGTETFFLSQIANDSDAQQLISTKNSIRPPIINSLTISYAIEAYPERCIAHNNLEYLDHSEACKSEGKRFSPFVGLEDDENALYLGFDKQLGKGPINIFFAAKELALTKEAKPKLGWKHGTMNGWTRLGCLDATKALARADILKLICSLDFSASSCLGSYLYWIKATLIEGGYEGKESPVLYGIYPNTAWASQAETVEDEILGSSDGTTDQEFEFAKIPVITAEIWVDEMTTLSDDEKNAIIEEYGGDSVSEVKDETGKALEVWVLWQAVEDFFNSTQASRHYLVDRVTGKTGFGNGVHGMVPPVGTDNIRATYQVGGGEAGNVPEFEITTLKTAIPYVDSVANPWSAGGGADVELLGDAMERGPWVIKHRDRAVTIEDFEWLARQASRDVARTKCMKEATGMEVGSVTVIILPKSGEDKPVPSFELENVVEKYLSERCSNVIALRVNGPVYIEVSVSLDVYPASIDMAAVAENETLDRLKSFLHPLTGGTDGGGWEFGRFVCTSDIYSLLEGIAEIDHVERVEARMFETRQGRRITVAPDANIPDALVCSGEHQVTIKLEGVA